MESFNSISAPADIGSFVSGQNVSVKVYPPPKAEFKPPDLPPPKQPDAPPINLVSGNIQHVYMHVHVHVDRRVWTWFMQMHLVCMKASMLIN